MKRPLLVATLLVAAFAARGYAQSRSTATDEQRVQMVSDLRTWATALTAYKTEKGEYPRASNIRELKEAVLPAYSETLPLLDPWGAFYIGWSDGVTFRVVSGGPDAVLLGESTMREGLRQMQCGPGDRQLGPKRNSRRGCDAVGYWMLAPKEKDKRPSTEIECPACNLPKS